MRKNEKKERKAMKDYFIRSQNNRCKKMRDLNINPIPGTLLTDMAYHQKSFQQSRLKYCCRNMCNRLV